MRKLFSALVLAGMATGLWAQVNDAPPAYVPPSEEVQRNAPPAPDLNANVKRSNRDARETYEASRLEPSERDMQRAREERSKRVDTGKVTKYRSEYGTIIEETHDQNNRVTDVRVTPGSLTTVRVPIPAPRSIRRSSSSSAGNSDHGRLYDTVDAGRALPAPRLQHRGAFVA